MSVEKKARLLKDWIKFKKAEESAEKKRVEIEKEIELLYGAFEGKSKTFTDEDIGFKTKISKNATAKFLDSWETVRKSVPSDMRPEKVKFNVDSEGLLFLKKHHEDVYKTVSDCIIVAPGKTSITVTKI